MSRRRVVVTGIGTITSLGRTFESTWRGLIGGENGIGPIPLSRWDASDHKCRIAALVADYDPTEYFETPEAKKLDLFAQYGLIASDEALADSGLDLDAEERDRIGCILGTGIGGIMAIEAQHDVLRAKGPRRVSPHFIPKMMPNAIAARISIRHGLEGTAYTTNSACAAAGHALGAALRAIQYGELDVALSGGAETPVTELSMAAFAAMKAMSTRNENPELACRPFDADRNGFVMGEGSGILVLEERDRAIARGARIYAEVAGYGATSDAFHITQPKEDAKGPRKAIRDALRDGDIDPETVDYVNAHGTSTHYNDLVETRALHGEFGSHASKLAISSTKSMVGHLLGGSAAVEAAVTCRSIHESLIHPTRNHESPGEGCDLDYVPGESRELPIRHAISNSLGFGGHNVCLAFRRHEA